MLQLYTILENQFLGITNYSTSYITISITLDTDLFILFDNKK